MKKLLSFLGILSLITMSFISCSSDDNDDNSSYNQTINPDALPNAAKSIISTYFNDTTVKSAKQSSTPNIRNSVYSALLHNGFEIDFDREGNWTEIENKYNQKIPENFLSQEVPKINEYVKANYPNHWITSVEKEHYGYSVELNSDIDLIFNQNQEFIGIDLDNDDEKEEIISSASLPQNSQNFVHTHFPNTQYVLTKKETENKTITFKVYLSSGYKLTFNSAGNWIDVESEINAAIPSAIVPSPIQNYISTQYSGYRVTGIEKKLYGYSVEIIQITKDIDLKFDSNGNFLGIDD